MRKVVGVIQARMGSSRLPGKPLLDIGGTSAVAYLVNRIRRCRSLAQIVLATSQHPQDDELVEECRRIGLEQFRGEESDVLGRLTQAGVAVGAATVVRITADDALMDPAVVDFMVGRFHDNPTDCATSLTTRSFPNGFVVSVFSIDALLRMDRLALSPLEREHVIPAFLAREDAFKVTHVEAPTMWTGYEFGLTLDTPSDYELVVEIVRRFERRIGNLEEILALLRSDETLRRRARNNGYYWEPAKNDAVHRL